MKGLTMSKNTLSKEWQQKELQSHEANDYHDPLEYEFLFYEAVQGGNIAYVEEDLKRGGFSNLAGKGTLSRHPLNNIKYHFVVTTALVTRNCVMAGMVQEQAYRLSDFYILKMDECLTVSEVIELHAKMVTDFTTRMYDLQKNRGVSKVITRSIEYIYSHIHNRITVEEMADAIGISPAYLSKLFKKEVGMSISDFIRDKKIKRAENLLRFSDYSYIEIANYLAFSSQSHFVNCFRKQVGITPKKYRDLHYRTTWETT